MTPSYFETFSVPILRGRGFLAADRMDTPHVAVVNDALARRYSGRDPIGKRFRLGDENGPWVEIVGVARRSAAAVEDSRLLPGGGIGALSGCVLDRCDFEVMLLGGDG